MNNKFIYLLYGAALAAVSGCSSLSREAHLTSDGALQAAPAAIAMRPHELGLEPVGDAEGSASTEKFLFFTISGDKPGDLSMPVFGSGAKSDLERLACWRAAQSNGGDAFYLTSTAWEKEGFLGIYRKRSVKVTGKSLKIKDMGHLSVERAERIKTVKAAAEEAKASENDGLLGLFGTSVKSGGDFEAHEEPAKRMDGLYFGAGLTGINTPNISYEGDDAESDVRPYGYVGYGLWPWLAVEVRGSLRDGYGDEYQRAIEIFGLAVDGVLKPKYSTGNFAAYGILGLSGIRYEAEIEDWSGSSWVEYTDDNTEFGVVVGAGLSYGWDWFALNAEICKYSYDKFEMDSVINFSVMVDL